MLIHSSHYCSPDPPSLNLLILPSLLLQPLLQTLLRYAIKATLTCRTTMVNNPLFSNPTTITFEPLLPLPFNR